MNIRKSMFLMRLICCGSIMIATEIAVAIPIYYGQAVNKITVHFDKYTVLRLMNP